VNVVNGITSGLAGMSSLGAPLTHREHAHGVVFVTGHAKPGDTGTDWVQLAHTAHQAKLTLVIYMGVSSLEHISHGLLQGLPGHTPVAVVQHASLPTQRQALTTLSQLVNTVHTQQLQSPSIIVVGDVVQVARALHPAQQAQAPSQRAA
jgi:uroporphyrin-III C-methyltransferase